MYQKPVIIKLKDLAEGIYAFSGDVYEEQLQEFVADEPTSDVQSSGGSISYSVELAGAWDGNKNYDLTITNNTEETITSATITVHLIGTVNSIDGNVSASINGDTAEITFNNGGNWFQLGPNSSVGPIYVHVTGSGEFRIE